MYDWVNEVIWVKNMLRYQAGKNGISPKITSAVKKDLESVHNSPLILEFLNYYNTLSIPYEYPLDRVSVTEREKEREKEKEREEREGEGNPASAGPIPFGDIVGQWNKICGAAGLPSVTKLTDGRKAKIKTRWREDGFCQGYRGILEAITQTPFLMGENDRGWKASFDWLFENDKNWVKVVERSYSSRAPATSGPAYEPPPGSDAWTEAHFNQETADWIVNAVAEDEAREAAKKAVGHGQP